MFTETSTTTRRRRAKAGPLPTSPWPHTGGGSEGRGLGRLLLPPLFPLSPLPRGVRRRRRKARPTTPSLEILRVDWEAVGNTLVEDDHAPLVLRLLLLHLHLLLMGPLGLLISRRGPWADVPGQVRTDLPGTPHFFPGEKYEKPHHQAH